MLRQHSEFFLDRNPTQLRLPHKLSQTQDTVCGFLNRHATGMNV